MSETRKEKRTPEPQPLSPKTLSRDESTDFEGSRLEEEIPDRTAVAPDPDPNTPCATDVKAFKDEPAPLQAHLNSVGERSSEDKQREALAALSRITGIPVDQIKLVDIVLGSVVLIVALPIAGAARLVAMQLLRHPMLREQGFAEVALDAPDSPTFNRAVRHEIAALDVHSPPSDAPSPYVINLATVRLRVTLAEEGE